MYYRNSHVCMRACVCMCLCVCIMEILMRAGGYNVPGYDAGG